MRYHEELSFAVAVAREAGEILTSYMDPELMGAREKGVGDVVTEADLRSESFVRERLAAEFPRDGLTGEEGADRPAAAERRWYVDPLDGTLNFSRQVPAWCVSVGLVEEGIPVVGVVHDPVRQETFAAASGQGATLNGRTIRCRPGALASDALVHMTVDFHDDSRLLGLDDMLAVAPGVLRVRNLGSAALALAYVAAGRLDAMIHRFAHAWDYVAGMALVMEAGGVASAIDGARYSPETHAVLASANGVLHDELLHLLPRTEGALE